jgi:hypothetical protein
MLICEWAGAVSIAIVTAAARRCLMIAAWLLETTISHSITALFRQKDAVQARKS